MKTTIILSSMLLVAVLFLVWNLIQTKKELASEKARPSFPQPIIHRYEKKPEKIRAVLVVPSGVPRELVEAELAGKLGKCLSRFWTVTKEIDYDVKYTATVWVLPMEEGRIYDT